MQAADRPGKCVHGPQACVRQRHASQEAGQGHVFTGLRIFGGGGTQQGTRRARQAFAAKAVRERVGGIREEGLE
jgi:hypothetical protein